MTIWSRAMLSDGEQSDSASPQPVASTSRSPPPSPSTSSRRSKRPRIASPTPEVRSRSTTPRVDDGEVPQEDEIPPEDMGLEMDLEKDANKHAGQPQKPEAGIIELLELQNFMCHKYFQVSLGSQVNFIIGDNGSGKSAVMAGLTMALGGSARATNRSNHLHSFIAKGAKAAVCAVRLSNEGPEAWKPEIYGKRIWVERRLQLDGPPSYRVLDSERKKVIVGTKAGLDEILEHWAIVVENPLVVLTQDQARTFLASSSTRDKYSFFLRATQLAQLTDTYEQILSRTTEMQQRVDQLRYTLDGKKDSLRTAKQNASAAQSAWNEEGRLDRLKEELVWSYVMDEEDKVKSAEATMAKDGAKIPKIDEDLTKRRDLRAEAEEEITVCREAEAGTEQNQEAIDVELEDAATVLKDARNEKYKFNRQVKSADSNVKSLRFAIESYTEAIAEQNRTLVVNPLLDRTIRLKELGDARVSAEEERISASNQVEKAEEEIWRLGVERLSPLLDRMESLRRERRTLETQRSLAGLCADDPGLRFGLKVAELVNAIETEDGWNRKPVGPIGRYVRLKEHSEEYRDALESWFGETLHGFAVADAEDSDRLKTLSKEAGCMVPIFRATLDSSFDCSSGEPRTAIMTVLRALEISDSLVEQTLVEALEIEKAALAPSRAEAEQLISEREDNVSLCVSADLFSSAAIGAGSSTFALSPWHRVYRLDLDFAAQQGRFDALIASIEEQLVDLETKVVNVRSKIAVNQSDRATAETQARTLSRRCAVLDLQIRQVEDDAEFDEPSMLSALEAEKKESEADLASLLVQFHALAAQQEPLEENIKQLARAKDKVSAKEQMLNLLKQNLQIRLEEAEKTVATEKDAIAKQQKKLDELEKQKQKHATEIAKWKTVLAAKTEEAAAQCARPQIVVEEGKRRKTVKKLKSEITSLEKALAARAKEEGATPEELISIYERIAKGIRDDKVQIKSFDALIDMLRKSYDDRVMRWTDFRKHISLRCKRSFQDHLSQRSFAGRLNIDHDHLKLTIVVNPLGEDAAQARGVQTLSGGEKSFSTLCFLLTLWDQIGCPFHCVDEVDVFMDEVNRRVSMRKLVDAAKASGKQYIFISPLKFTFTKNNLGHAVRVHRLANPDRAQGVLSFARGGEEGQ